MFTLEDKQGSVVQDLVAETQKLGIDDIFVKPVKPKATQTTRVAKPSSGQTFTELTGVQKEVISPEELLEQRIELIEQAQETRKSVEKRFNR